MKASHDKDLPISAVTCPQIWSRRLGITLGPPPGLGLPPVVRSSRAAVRRMIGALMAAVGVLAAALVYLLLQG